MFEDITMSSDETEEIISSDDIAQTAVNDQIKKNQQSALISDINEKKEQADDVLQQLDERRSKNEDLLLSKTEEEAMHKVLRKKYEEEQKRREAFFRKQQEEEEKRQWEEEQERLKKQKQKPKLSIGSLMTNFLPKSTGELTDKEVRQIQKENEQMREMAFMDALTGLYNRNKYELDIKGIPLKGLTIVSVDANNLKYMNDNFGHEAGDTLLKSIATDLKEQLQIEHIYRTGGDEYVCLFLNESQDTIALKLNAFEQALEKRNNDKESFVYAAAYGYSTFMNGDTFESIQKRADEKMYAMKKMYKESHPAFDMRKKQTVTPDNTPQKEEVKQSTKPAKPKKKSKKTKTVHHIASSKQVEVLPAIVPKAQPQAEEIHSAEFIPSKKQSFATTQVNSEYITMKDRLKQIRTESKTEEVIAMVDEINDFKKDIIMICIVTQDLNTLFLIRNADNFFNVMEQLDDEIAVSYIYVLYKTVGMKYYIQKPDEILIQNILSDIAELFRTNTKINSGMLAKVPNIGFFENIYI